ncbi:MAG: hypothetical protein IIB28_02685, partial [Chloroflexi bacterium]|nr:hypothetical protein [Chloroflexota bacterium]
MPYIAASRFRSPAVAERMVREGTGLDVSDRQWLNRFLLVAALFAAAVVFAACGGESETADGTVTVEGGESLAIGSRVVELDRVLTFADFEAAGVK